MSRIRVPAPVMLRLMAALVAAMVLVPGGQWAYRHFFPVLVVANLSGRPGLTVTLDGSTFAAGLDSAVGEAAQRPVIGRARSGRRTLVATDAAGRVIDRREVELRPGQAHLYTPGRGPGVCLQLQTVRSGSPRLERQRPLDPAGVFHVLEGPIHHWFEPVPRYRSRGRSPEQRAVRQRPCDAR